MLSLDEVRMDTARIIKIVTAVATLATAAALLFGFVWSIATGQKVIMPVVCGTLLAMFGLFIRNDYYYFFGKKNEPTDKTQV
jgi:hypothetical protein